jgi:hypothetical protein
MFKKLKKAPHSLSTESLQDVVKARILGNSGVMTNENAQENSTAQNDVEKLQIGVRKDGGPQQLVTKRKQSPFKSQEIDLSKYMMTSGYAVDTKQLSMKRNLG